MPPPSAAASRRLVDAAPVFAALGDPTRLRLVARLCDCGPLPIVRLAEGSHVSRQAISKHLAALADAGLVESERSGRERVWRLQPARLAEVRRCLDRISAQWDQALERLRTLVE